MQCIAGVAASSLQLPASYIVHARARSQQLNTVVDDAGFGIMSTLLFGVVYAGLLLVPNMHDLWQAVRWLQQVELHRARQHKCAPSATVLSARQGARRAPVRCRSMFSLTVA